MDLLRRIARTLNVLLVLGIAAACGAGFQYACAQTAGPTPPSAQPAAPANAAPSSQAAPADPHIDKSQIAQRLNQELDFNLEATTGGWQHALDRLESDLARPRLRYTELNRLRDELQRIRSDVAEAWNKIQPRLDADRDSDKLLGPAPAAGQPQEPEQAARSRAELNYHFGLLSAAAKRRSIRPIFASTIYSTPSRTSAGRTSPPHCFNRYLASTPMKPGRMLPQYVPDAARSFAT